MIGKTKILIVEDEVIAGMALCTKFNDSENVDCKFVSSGEEAIRSVEGDPPHIVLMDISLRGEIGGIEAALEIRSRFGVPIIFMTGYPDQDMKDQAEAAEPIAYFVKPLEYAELMATIEASLAEK
jgi:CheY-like chemotaxis protein